MLLKRNTNTIPSSHWHHHRLQPPIILLLLPKCSQPRQIQALLLSTDLRVYRECTHYRVTFVELSWSRLGTPCRWDGWSIKFAFHCTDCADGDGAHVVFEFDALVESLSWRNRFGVVRNGIEGDVAGMGVGE